MILSWDQKHLIKEAWGCKGIYRSCGGNPFTHGLYLFKFIVCVLLKRYLDTKTKNYGITSVDYILELEKEDYPKDWQAISVSAQYPVYNSMFDPPDPAWDEYFVSKGWKNWYYTYETFL